MIKLFLRLFLFCWELPQNILGIFFLIMFFLRKRINKISFEKERYFIEIKSEGAISLGLFIFHTTKDNNYVPVGLENKNHEYGHSIQSRYLGPFYLFTVGLSSEIRLLYAVIFKKYFGHRWDGYYSGFPEKSADKMGEADLSLRPAP